MWKGYYVDICVLRAQDQPALPVFNTFHEAFKFCVEETNQLVKDLSYCSLARSVDINKNTLLNYGSTLTTPRSTSFSAIERLEEYFIEKLGIPKGTLTRFVPRYIDERTLRKQFVGQTQFSRTIIAAQKRRREKGGCSSLVEKEINATFASEFAGLTDFKTRVDPSVLGLTREDCWTLRPENEYRGSKWHKKYVLSPDGLSSSPAASISFEKMLDFFGVLRDLGAEAKGDSAGPYLSSVITNPANFSLVYLVDSKILLSVIAEMKKRNGGFLTNRHVMIFKEATALSRTNYGYVYQQPVFATKLPCPENFTPEEWANLTPEQWNEWCTKERTKINEQLRKYEDSGEIHEDTRDSWEAIQRFIDYVDPETGKRSPITALLTVADSIAERIVWLAEQCKHYPDKPSLQIELLANERDFFFFSLIACLPLRISMFMKMTYRSRGRKKANLYKRPDGTWAVYFHYLDFKNWRHLKKNNYDVGLPARMTPIIEHWLDFDQKPGQMLRRKCKFFKNSDLVFEPLPTTKKVDDNVTEFDDNVTEFLTAAYQRRMLRVHGGPMVSPHSSRHLVASHIVINSTSGDRFQDAAEVLHEDVKTVRRHYTRLIAETGNQNYHNSLEALIKRRNGNG